MPVPDGGRRVDDSEEMVALREAFMIACPPHPDRKLALFIVGVWEEVPNTGRADVDVLVWPREYPPALLAVVQGFLDAKKDLG